MTDWRLVDGRSCESGEGQLIVKGGGALDIGAPVALVYESTPALEEWTPTARMLAAAPDLARLAAELTALALALGDALAAHGLDPSTRQGQRDTALLVRTQDLISEAKGRLGEVYGE